MNIFVCVSELNKNEHRYRLDVVHARTIILISTCYIGNLHSGFLSLFVSPTTNPENFKSQTSSARLLCAVC